MDITQEYLIDNFTHSDKTGYFYKSHERATIAAKRIRVSVNGDYYTTRDLVWIYHNGSIPCGLHVVNIDGNVCNNKIGNLALVNQKRIQDKLKERYDQMSQIKKLKATLSTQKALVKRAADKRFIDGVRSGRVPYHVYLKSELWDKRRERFNKRYKQTCGYCGNRCKSPNLHHLSYDKVGDEPDDHLVWLCRDCHKEVHDIDYQGELLRHRRPKKKKK